MVTIRKTPVVIKETPDNLNHFRNDLLGLEFDYPKDWGEVRTEPAEALTNLATANQDFKDRDDNGYQFRIELHFTRNPTYIYLIDDRYNGELLSNYSASKYGPIDNWNEIKISQDACDYKIDFNKGIYHAKSIYSDCQKGINEMLIKEWHDDWTVVSYRLNRYGYKRLRNGYFDNLWLVESPIKFQHRNPEISLTVSDVKLRLENPDKDLQDKEAMTKLLASIKSYPPIIPTKPVFKDIPEEEEDITLIRKYYHLLSIHDFEQAAKLSVNFSLENIRDWYKDIYNAEPINFKKLGQGNYEFEVDYQDENMLPVKYLVKMTVVNGKLKTIKSEKYITPIIHYGDMSAVVKDSQNYNYVVLTKNNQEYVVKKAENSYKEDFSNGSEVAFLDDILFSPTGKYLAYRYIVWEAFGWGIIDTATLKPIDIQLPSTHTLFFNSNDTKLFVCAQSDLDGERYAEIYDLTNLVKIKDFIKDTKAYISESAYYINCSFKEDIQQAEVEIKPWDETFPSDTMTAIMD